MLAYPAVAPYRNGRVSKANHMVGMLCIQTLYAYYSPSGMQYRRTMKITYLDYTLNEEAMSQLAHHLQQNGMTIHDWHGAMPEYGVKTTTQRTTRFCIKRGNKTIISFDYRHRAKEAFEQLVKHYKVSPPVEEVLTTETTDWVRPKGEMLSFNDNFDARFLRDIEFDQNAISSGQFVFFAENAYTTDQTLRLKVRLANEWNCLALKFVMVWDNAPVSRSDKIQEVLVDVPLEIMGQIQRRVESALEEICDKDEFESPTIDCNFEALNHTKSECAPDIIKAVREARNQGEEE